jgi:hypothetical protein
MGKDYIVTDCIEHPEKNRCVDIIQQRDGKYRFQEWRRDSEDTTGWILLLDSQPVVFDSEAGAMSAAQFRCKESRQLGYQRQTMSQDLLYGLYLVEQFMF